MRCAWPGGENEERCGQFVLFFLSVRGFRCAVAKDRQLVVEQRVEEKKPQAGFFFMMRRLMHA